MSETPPPALDSIPGLAGAARWAGDGKGRLAAGANLPRSPAVPLSHGGCRPPPAHALKKRVRPAAGQGRGPGPMPPLVSATRRLDAGRGRGRNGAITSAVLGLFPACEGLGTGQPGSRGRWMRLDSDTAAAATGTSDARAAPVSAAAARPDSAGH